MTPGNRSRRTWNTKGPLLIGLITMVVLVFGIGFWSVRTNISGAVIGKGKVHVSSHITAVQHEIGGVVSDIYVYNGDKVEAGQVMVRLDDTHLRAKLATTEGELYETLANLARLEAELDDRKQLLLHPLLEEAVQKNADVAALLERQQRQLDAHFETLRIEEHLLRERMAQVEDQIIGVEAQVATFSRRSELINNELEQVQSLTDKGLMKASTHYSLLKDALNTEGEIGRLSARSAELRGKVSELELEIHALLPDAKDKAETELSKLRPAKTKFIQARNRLIEDLARLDIRAPVSGFVHDSQVKGLRSVVVAASPLMFIVPDNAPVLVRVRVDAGDIDQLYNGQDAALRFKAFNRRSAPIILGTVSNISADAFTDPKTRKIYYDVDVSLISEEMEKLGEHSLIPGMPAEAFITTDPRSPMNYVTRPLISYFNRAFRDT